MKVKHALLERTGKLMLFCCESRFSFQSIALFFFLFLTFYLALLSALPLSLLWQTYLGNMYGSYRPPLQDNLVHPREKKTC